MIIIKNKEAQEKMAQTGALLARLFVLLADYIEQGLSTGEIDAWIQKYLDANNLVSSTRGYMGYKHVSCISVNDEVVHGIPAMDAKLKDGNLVKVDVCASYQGYCADMARCFFIGTPAAQLVSFVNVAQEALDCGIRAALDGNRLSAISVAVQTEVERHGYGVVREFAGHGIGKKMHEEPEILNYGKPNCGPVIRPGMAFAIEPMITMGNHQVYVTKDGWTVKTVDKSFAAHIEDTVIVTEDGPRIITRL